MRARSWRSNDFSSLLFSTHVSTFVKIFSVGALAWTISLTPSLTHGEEAIDIQWGSTSDSTSAYTFKDANGDALAQGTAGNQDGSVIELGYFTLSNDSNVPASLFLGDFVSLTPGTTIGDSSYGSGTEPGTFSFTTKFIFDSQTVTVFPNRPATYDINASHLINSSTPPTNTLLAIRFYDQTSITNSAKYNTVASPEWKWPAYIGNAPPEIEEFRAIGDSGTGNTSTNSESIYGNYFENNSSPYQTVIPFEFNLTLLAQGPGTVGPADANKSYEYDTNVQITATATDINYEFARWSGSGVADSNASLTTVSMTEDRNVTAEFDPKDYTLIVDVNNSAYGSATGSGSFPYGSSQSINALPNEGYRFLIWSGVNITDSNSASTTVAIDGDRTVTANFVAKEYNLEVNATVGGTETHSAGPYYHFSVYDLNASPGTGYSFSEWTGDVAGVADVNASNTTISLTADANVTAEFTINHYLLTVNSDANGDANGTGTYPYNQTVAISATPNEGYVFTEWTGTGVGSLGDVNASTTTVLIPDANVTIQANFELRKYDLTVNANQGGDANGTGIYNHFDQVPIVATPIAGWSFDQWLGNTSALLSSSASTTVDIVADTNVTANFSRNQYTLTVLSGTGGDANGSGTFTFEDNRTITASANPPTGYEFSHWSGDVATVADVNASSTSIQIPAFDVNVTANFVPRVYTVTIEPATGGVVSFSGDANSSVSISKSLYYSDSVTIEANASGPDPTSLDINVQKRGYAFTYWIWSMNGIDGNTSEQTYTFNVEGDFNATAHFLSIDPFDYELTLNVNPSTSSGTYSVSKFTWDEDSFFPITAIPNNGHTFLAWTSDEINAFSPGDFNATAIINLDDNSTATAHFLQNQYFLELATSAGGSLSGGGGSSFAYGDSADANATPDSIHDFDQWVIDKTIDYSVAVGTKAHDPTAPVYIVKGQERPSLTFVRGFTYSFEVNGSHPFYFSTDPNGGGDYAQEYTDGVTDSNASGGSTIVIAVDDSTPALLYYYSGLTAGMGSPIKVVTLTDSEILPFPTQASTNVTIETDLSLQATFKLKTYDLSLTSGNGGSAAANQAGPHEHGTIITLTATPDEGYDFDSWSGDGIDDATSDTTTVSMTEARSIMANFKIKSYLLTLSSASSGGTVRTSDNETLYEHGSSANILATPNQGYSFVQWTGDSTSTDRNTTILMDGNKSATGTFQENVHSLTITQVTKNADGTNNADIALGGSVFAGSTFEHGSIATLIATANPGYEFAEWETNGTIDLAVSVESGAYFLKDQSQPTLILVRGNTYNFNLDGTTTSGNRFYLSTSNDGGGTLNGIYTEDEVSNSNVDSGTVSFSPDDSTPDTLYYYSADLGGMGNEINVIDASSISLGQFSSTSANTHVTMVADRSYQAVFKRKSYNVTYSVYPESSGYISFDSYDGSSSIEHGSTITSTATEAEGYKFINWSGEGLTPSQQLNSTLSLSITSTQTITANFAKQGEIRLTLLADPEAAGSVAGSGTYEDYNPSLSIYAKANDGYVFIGWQGGEGHVQDLNGSVTTVNLIDDLTLTALFELVPSKANEPKARSLQAVYSGWDWWHSDWFGSYWYISGRNWVYHTQLGWCYVVIQSDESVWIWMDFLEGWFWTNPTVFPFIFDYNGSAWMWFNQEESTHYTGTRIFYSFSIEDWVEY